MEPSTTPDYSGSTEVKTVTKSNLLMICDPLCHPTSVSKILAAVLFIILPFIGAYVGYQLGLDSKSVNEEVSVPVAALVSEPHLPDGIIQFESFSGEMESTKYSIRNGMFFYEENNLGVTPKQTPIAYDEDVVLVDGQFWYRDSVLAATIAVREIGHRVFLTDNAIFTDSDTNQEGESLLVKAYSDVDSVSFKPVVEFSEASSTNYLRPVADGDYGNQWFTDNNSFYCVSELKEKLTVPVEVVFHEVDSLLNKGKSEILVNGKSFLLWNQVNNANALGYVTFKESSSTKEYDTNCQLLK